VATFLKDLGTMCGGGTECNSTNCVSGVCCNTACTDACSACNVTGSVGMCTTACGAFACNTSENSCYDTCETSAECVSGGTCANGSCLIPDGGTSYALSGGGFSGCSYGGSDGSASSLGGLALLGMLALFLGRRRLAERTSSSLA
jgi:MYXO-CTERM domain-containing protein